MTFEDGQLRFACQGSGFEVDFSAHIHLEWQDQARLLADMGRGATAIAELGLDINSGGWYFKCLRPDKDRANHLNTVVQTLLELAENITSEELEYRLLARSAMEDDWEYQKSKMAQSALDHQRRKIKQQQEQLRHSSGKLASAAAASRSR
mmetsp:Transcript_15266/g.45238  ORF Transcript_15266/g.45238 Transcript_15266/m.45238 type:complete len:150 (-) Transcript_15266:53-502(-)